MVMFEQADDPLRPDISDGQLDKMPAHLRGLLRANQLLKQEEFDPQAVAELFKPGSFWGECLSQLAQSSKEIKPGEKPNSPTIVDWLHKKHSINLFQEVSRKDDDYFDPDLWKTSSDNPLVIYKKNSIAFNFVDETSNHPDKRQIIECSAQRDGSFDLIYSSDKSELKLKITNHTDQVTVTEIPSNSGQKNPNSDPNIFIPF